METRVLEIHGEDSLGLFKALASEKRVRILELLSHSSMNINELSQELSLSQSTVTRHMQDLERAGVVRSEYRPGVQGTQKRCYLNFDRLVVSFEALRGPQFDVNEVQMPIGLYTLVNASSSGGIAGAERIIGQADHPQCFYHPDRGSAQILWMADGFVEYVFPCESDREADIRKLEFVAEVCSDAPLHVNEFPSDITVWVNGIEVGTWTCPGDFSDERGRLNPKWWNDSWTQYGVLKTWCVDESGSSIDGIPASDVTIRRLMVSPHAPVTVRIGCKPTATHIGGFTLFGTGFGNFAQDLLLRVHYGRQSRGGRKGMRRESAELDG